MVPFKHKVTATFTVLLALSLLATTLITIEREQALLMENLIKEKTLEVKTIAMSVTSAEINFSPAHKREVIRGVGEMEGVAYCRLVKPTGEIFVSSNPDERGLFIDDVAILTTEVITKDEEYNNESIKVIVAPSYKGYTVWLGFRTSDVERSLEGVTKTNALMALIALIAGALISFFMADRLTKPIKDLQMGARELGRGDLSHSIKIKTNDEFGELSKSFETMRKQLKKSREEMTEEVRKRTKELTNKSQELEKSINELENARAAMMSVMDDLDTANKELRAQEEMREAFLRNVAHELKTPITIMKLDIERLMRREVKRVRPYKANKAIGKLDNTELLKDIYNGTERFSRTIAKILHLSRLEAGAIIYNKKKCDIDSFISDVMKEYKLLAGSKQLYLKKELQKGLPKLLIDKEQMREVLHNLMGNAIKFTDKGCITVRAKREGDKVRFEVEDTGMGIPEDAIPKLFTKFYQVDAGLARSKPGTGLGLAITKATIRDHNGKIWVESKVGVGSKFIFLLPIKPVTGEN